MTTAGMQRTELSGDGALTSSGKKGAGSDECGKEKARSREVKRMGSERTMATAMASNGVEARPAFPARKEKGRALLLLVSGRCREGLGSN
jgi:hypothetical protein